MGNFDEAVRAMPPPKNLITCLTCGALVPLTGDVAHDVTTEPAEHGLSAMVLVCHEPPKDPLRAA